MLQGPESKYLTMRISDASLTQVRLQQHLRWEDQQACGLRRVPQHEALHEPAPGGWGGGTLDLWGGGGGGGGGGRGTLVPQGGWGGGTSILIH